MDRVEQEKLIDILLGEAVMVLLREEAAISNVALIKQLKLMALAEPNSGRQSVYTLAISEVRNYAFAIPDAIHQHVQERENKRHLFNHNGPPDGTKKH